MPSSYSTDIVLFGGGVAGLWLLDRLVAEGYRAILLEQDRLGGGQSINSQGIIHGGLKYALHGAFGGASRAIADMPRRWRDCIEGRGEIDLSACRILSPHFLLWSGAGLGAGMKAFLGSKAVVGKAAPVAPAEVPAILRARGAVYRLPDFVLDSASLIEILAAPHRQRIHALRRDGACASAAPPHSASRAGPTQGSRKPGNGRAAGSNAALQAARQLPRALDARLDRAPADIAATPEFHRPDAGSGPEPPGQLAAAIPEFRRAGGGRELRARLAGQSVLLKASRYIFCAGEGNGRLIEAAGLSGPRCQLRPLKMVAASGPSLPPLFLHAAGAGLRAAPALTITSHRNARDEPVWYLGGELAETGAARSDQAQVEAAKSLLRKLFPQLDFDDMNWRCLDINRAEPAVAEGCRPDNAAIACEEDVIVAWPTKLTLAPALADIVLRHLRDEGVEPGAGPRAGQAMDSVPAPENAASHGQELEPSAVDLPAPPPLARPFWD